MLCLSEVCCLHLHRCIILIPLTKIIITTTDTLSLRTVIVIIRNRIHQCITEIVQVMVLITTTIIRICINRIHTIIKHRHIIHTDMRTILGIHHILITILVIQTQATVITTDTTIITTMA